MLTTNRRDLRVMEAFERDELCCHGKIVARTGREAFLSQVALQGWKVVLISVASPLYLIWHFIP